MRRWKKVLLLILLAAVLGVGLLAVRQRKNIKAVYMSVRYSQEELEQRLEDNRKRVQEAVDRAPALTVRDLTEDEKQALRDGSVTAQELVGQLTSGEAEMPQAEAGEAAGQAEQPSGEDVPETAAADAAYQRALSELVARAYILREEYQSKLDELQASAKADYRAIPKAERTRQVQLDLVGDYLGRALDLEKACDAEMLELVTEMEALIKENNGDLSFSDTVFQSYLAEKDLKKAWYMSELEKRGF